MKKYPLALAILLLMVSFVIHNSPDKKAFKKLYALEGKWIMKTDRGALGEEWVKINDDHLQSRGFFIKGKDTIVSERVALKNTKEGIFYTSTVENQNDRQPVPFKLTSSAKNIFIFENTAHNFPKRIVYEIISADSLHAYIDNGENVTGREDFYYRKVN